MANSDTQSNATPNKVKALAKKMVSSMTLKDTARLTLPRHLRFTVKLPKVKSPKSTPTPTKKSKADAFGEDEAHVEVKDDSTASETGDTVFVTPATSVSSLVAAADKTNQEVDVLPATPYTHQAPPDVSLSESTVEVYKVYVQSEEPNAAVDAAAESTGLAQDPDTSDDTAIEEAALVKASPPELAARESRSSAVLKFNVLVDAFLQRAEDALTVRAAEVRALKACIAADDFAAAYPLLQRLLAEFWPTLTDAEVRNMHALLDAIPEVLRGGHALQHPAAHEKTSDAVTTFTPVAAAEKPVFGPVLPPAVRPPLPTRTAYINAAHLKDLSTEAECNATKRALFMGWLRLREREGYRNAASRVVLTLPGPSTASSVASALPPVAANDVPALPADEDGNCDAQDTLERELRAKWAKTQEEVGRRPPLPAEWFSRPQRRVPDVQVQRALPGPAAPASSRVCAPVEDEDEDDTVIVQAHPLSPEERRAAMYYSSSTSALKLTRKKKAPLRRLGVLLASGALALRATARKTAGPLKAIVVPRPTVTVPVRTSTRTPATEKCKLACPVSAGCDFGFGPRARREHGLARRMRAPRGCFGCGWALDWDEDERAEAARGRLGQATEAAKRLMEDAHTVIQELMEEIECGGV